MAERVTLTARGTHSGAFRLGEWRFVGTLAMVWGSSFLLLDIALESLAPAFIAPGRVVLGALTLVLVPRARRRIANSDRLLVGAAGLAGIGVPLLLFSIAQQSVDSAVAGAFVAAIPVASALIHMALSRRLLRLVQLAGILVGFLGVLGLLAPGLGGHASLGGMALILVAVFALAFANNVYAPLQQKYGGATVMLWGHATSALILLPLWIVGLGDSHYETSPALAFVVLGVVSTGLARVLHITVVGRVGPARGAVTGYAVPVVAVALGVMLRNDTIEAIQIAGLAVTLIGGFLVSRRE